MVEIPSRMVQINKIDWLKKSAAHISRKCIEIMVEIPSRMVQINKIDWLKIITDDLECILTIYGLLRQR